MALLLKNRKSKRTRMKETTVKIDAARREELVNAAFELTVHRGRVVTVTEIIKALVDRCLKDYVKKSKRE